MNGQAPELPGSRRERLLQGAIAYFAEHGTTDVSLRTLAAALGTSHRMLLYHFGSKEALLVEVVKAVEAAQRQMLVELDERTAVEATETAFWRHVSDPSLAPFARLFYEIYGQALQRRPWAVPLLDGVVDDWIDPVAAALEERGLSPGEARAEARLGVAVSRGLLLDLLATGDREAVDAAAERFFARYRQRSGQ